jgi:hypothetical protein
MGHHKKFNPKFRFLPYLCLQNATYMMKPWQASLNKTLNNRGKA